MQIGLRFFLNGIDDLILLAHGIYALYSIDKIGQMNAFFAITPAAPVNLNYLAKRFLDSDLVETCLFYQQIVLLGDYRLVREDKQGTYC